MNCERVVNAHGRSEVLGIVITESKDLATVGLDGFLRVWDCSNNDFIQKKKIAIPSPYLHCFKNTRKGLSIGLADGSLAFLDFNTLKIIEKIKLHNDLLTDLIELEDSFISSSLDGSIIRFSKKTFQIIEQANFHSPVWKLKQFVNSLYISSQQNTYFLSNINNSLNSAKVLPNCKCKGFQIFNGQLFGYNSSSIIQISSNTTLNQECDILLPTKDKLIAIRQGKIGIVSKKDNVLQILWQQIPQLQQGYQIRCSLQFQNKIYITGDSGKIVVLKVDQDN